MTTLYTLRSADRLFWFTDPSIVPGAPNGLYVEQTQEKLQKKLDKFGFRPRKKHKKNEYYAFLAYGWDQISEHRTLEQALKALSRLSEPRAMEIP